MPPIKNPDAESDMKQYRVTGRHSVLGRKPGQVFSAALEPHLEQFLVAAGHLVVVTPHKKEEDQ